MAQGILDQDGPPIRGIPLKDKGCQRHLPFFTKGL